MKVSKSGYYYWKTTPQSLRCRQNDKILFKILQSFKQSRRTYGSPRIYHDLKAQGIKVGLNKVARLMSQNNIYAHFSICHKKAKIPRNNVNFTNNILNREFSAATPNSKWVSDTTFVHTKQGWLYLATVIDLYSRRVVGWSMNQNNNTKLIIDALSMAIKNKPKQQKVLLHSDQGSTYRAYEYLKLFKANNITQSMSRKGECHDNAVAESFFNTLKTELINQKIYQTRKQASSAIFERPLHK
ncbi:Mobile element protein [Bathymodiolus heckerae thiotrophic gill symbiont]|nr:Mobile element protein [Bathymodiolus heckerae thiotrophic gill symbiont]